MTRYLASFALLSVLATSACSSKSGGGGGGSGTSGGMSGMGGMSGSGSGGSSTTGGGGGNSMMSGSSGSGGDKFSCVNEGDVNPICPGNLPPISGSCAPHGDCCYRTSNNARIAALGPDDPAVIEYRLNYVEITNHPLSIGLPDLVNSAKTRASVCAGEQCLLWRFTAPRKGGEFVAGPGEVEIGIGAYNCNGTYSYYGSKAAPDRTKEVGESDPGRWQSVKVPADVDPSKMDVDRFHIPWATNRNREIARSIFIWPSDWSIDWELASSGFTITEFPWSEAAQNCLGTRERGNQWTTVNGFVAYSPLKGNDKDISNQTNTTYCALLAFGLLPEGMKDKDCIATDRCMPDGGVFGDGGCDWIKLPDALCPETDAERKIFGCHLGAEGNPNAEDGYPDMLKCSQDKPADPLDTDMGATSEGQCCDPLGKSSTLPGCNAYRTVGKYVAAAAEITDDPIDDLPPACH